MVRMVAREPVIAMSMSNSCDRLLSSPSGPVWASLVTLTGIFPTVFAITGIVMWLRKRSGRKEPAGKHAKPRLRPAE